MKKILTVSAVLAASIMLLSCSENKKKAQEYLNENFPEWKVLSVEDSFPAVSVTELLTEILGVGAGAEDRDDFLNSLHGLGLYEKYLDLEAYADSPNNFVHVSPGTVATYVAHCKNTETGERRDIVFEESEDGKIISSSVELVEAYFQLEERFRETDDGETEKQFI